MPKPRPPYLHRQVTRHGGVAWYVRKGHGPRRRIRSAFGTPEFDAEYQAALADRPAPPPRAQAVLAHNSVAWLIARYRDTTGWLKLSPATKRQRENIFARIIETDGRKPFAGITKAHILAARDRRAKTPAQARNYLDAMRGLFRWALEAEHVTVDPTAGVKNPSRKDGHGFVSWSEDDVAIYRAHWALGTPQRVWMEVLLATGLRRGDAVRFGRQHIRTVALPDGRTIKVGVIKTEKSGKKVEAVFPITEEFEQAMAAGPCGDLAFICGERGAPLSKESFGNMFRAACGDAKVPGSAHGLRKLASIRAAHNGATTAQMRAMFGWTSDAMPSLYTKAADRMRLGIEGALLVRNETRLSIPSPGRQVRELEEKTK